MLWFEDYATETDSHFYFLFSKRSTGSFIVVLIVFYMYMTPELFLEPVLFASSPPASPTVLRLLVVNTEEVSSLSSKSGATSSEPPIPNSW